MSNLTEKRYGISGDVIVAMLFVSVLLIVWMGIRLESNSKEFEVVVSKLEGNRDLFLEKTGWIEEKIENLEKYHNNFNQ